MPIVGNHEYYSGAKLGRYLDSTWEQWGPIQGGDVDPAAEFHTSTATSALGAFLSTGSHHAAGTFGANEPSNSSRYFSVDFGLVHLISLDLNVYYGNDPCGDECKQDQLAWLIKDLEAANKNRDSQPWIVASAHYPVFCTGCNSNTLSAAYYASDRAEIDGNCNATASAAFDGEMMEQGNGFGARVGGASADLVKDFAPLLQQYGVDLFMAGHWHYYESLWPTVAGTDDCPACAVPLAKSFEEPKGTVHITTGNAGPPGKDSFVTPIPASRQRSQEYGYGRLVAHNSSVMEFWQFENEGGTEIDHIVITQSSHGPFPSSLEFAV
jgi:3',5'-cyclic AMP phosphodiesterase CpdA